MFIVTLICSTLGPPRAVPSFHCVQCRMDAARLACLFFSTAGLRPPLCASSDRRRGTLKVRNWPLQSFYLGNMQDTVQPEVILSSQRSSTVCALASTYRRLVAIISCYIWTGGLGREKLSFIPSTRQDWGRFKMRKIARLEFIPVRKNA